MKREFKKPQNQTELTLRFCEPNFFVIREAFSGFQADFLHRFARNKLTNSSTGNMIAARIPMCRSFPKALDTRPASVGPPEQPTSPASASIANIAVPPPRIPADALLNVPGQRIPTEKPHTAQPKRPANGTGTNTMHK